MAVMLILAGSILGFFGGLLAYFVLGASFVTALSIWALSGPLALAFLARPRAPSPSTAGYPAATDDRAAKAA